MGEKKLRKVVLKTHSSGAIVITSPGIRSCRLRIEEQGKIISCQMKKNLEKVEIKAGTTYLWDRFHK